MTVDEIACHIMGRTIEQAHPDDLAFWRETVQTVIRLHETPHRWVDDGKPPANNGPDEALTLQNPSA